MQNPVLIVSREKLYSNIKTMIRRCKKAGIEISAVTKVFCALPEIVDVFIAAGIKTLADSRVQNLKKMAHLKARKMLIRMPMLSEVPEVIKYVDISCNSEIETVKALSDEAVKQNVVHGVILMIEMGDLREGMLPDTAADFAGRVLGMQGVRLLGLGSNFNCYGGVLPTEEKLSQLVALARKIEKTYGIEMPIVSGGNSGSLYLVQEKRMPAGINNLRIGETILRGYETSFQKKIDGLHTDVFTLRAEIIELKEKPSVPNGEIGKDAFGNEPKYIDRGIRSRAILACGRQDILWDHILPLDEGIELIGASSDHLIMDVTNAEKTYIVGDTVDFSLDYGALLAACTSEYVSKVVC